MQEQLLEGEAVEEPAPVSAPEDEVRALAERDSARALSPWRGEVRSAAIAAAGGLVAGAATVAAVKATRAATGPGRRLVRRPRSRDRMPGVLASRSFLIDVHLLDR